MELRMRWKSRADWRIGDNEVMRTSVEYGRICGSTLEAVRRETLSIVMKMKQEL
jgi:hypothetical protein